MAHFVEIVVVVFALEGLPLIEGNGLVVVVPRVHIAKVEKNLTMIPAPLPRDLVIALSLKTILVCVTQTVVVEFVIAVRAIIPGLCVSVHVDERNVGEFRLQQ